MALPLDKIIERIRRLTQQESFTDSATLISQIGLQTQTVVDLYNEALRVLRGFIYSNSPDLYIKTSTANVVSGVEAVTLPTDAFLGVNVLSVEYKYGSSAGQYHKLQRKGVWERDNSISGIPVNYVQVNNNIMLNPKPSTSVTDGLRITYEYKVPTIDVRRGKVSAVDDANDPTSITITDKTQGDISLNGDVKGLYITIVDKDGQVQMKNIPVSSYSSGVITLESFTSEASEVVSVNDYVVMGTDSSTHSSFPDFCDSFLVDYVTFAIMEMYGHPSVGIAATKVQAQTEQLKEVFSRYHMDLDIISEIDPSRSFDRGYPYG